MGGISGSGLISGIDTQSLINSLIQVAARPRTLAQSRLIQLQSQQAAYFDLNSRLGSLRSAASNFRSSNVFLAKTATSSNPDALSATASIGAQPGTYSFIVDRLVSSQQQLSRGFQDLDTTAVGLERLTFESTDARLDRDLSLNALNDGDGVLRGTIRVNDGTSTAEIDLSRAATVEEVLDEINSSGLDVTARVRDGRFEIVGATSVTNAGSTDVAGSLGLSSAAGASVVDGVLEGATVYELTDSVALSALNDGNGVSLTNIVAASGAATDFTITIGGTDIDIGLGEIRGTDDNGTPADTSDDIENAVLEPAVTTVGGMIDRINQAFTDAGVDATASIDAASGALSFSSNAGNITAITANASSKAARDLGLESATGLGSTSITGARIFSGMGTVLLSNLNGGGDSGGLSLNGTLDIETRDGGSLELTVDSSSYSTVEELIDAINNDADNAIGGDPLNGPAVRVSLNSTGTGLQIEDLTGGTGNFIVESASAQDIAQALGIATDASGVASDTVGGESLQRRYISEATRLDSLRNGDGIGTGRLRFIDSSGQAAEVQISDSVETVGELLRQIQSATSELDIEVAINDQGDGLVVRDTSGIGTNIQVEDVEGAVGTNLQIAGESSGIGADNFIDGSFETNLEFDPTDTLQDIIDAVNNSNANVAVSVLNDGSGTRPFRLSLTSRDSGTEGRFLIDTNGFDLGLQTLDEGEDARVIFGSNDAATGILLTSSTNQIDDVITGVSIDLKNTSEDPVVVSVTDDTSGVEESIVQFITAYNTILDGIENSTRFDEDTGERGALLGDGLLLGLRGGLFNAIQQTNDGFTNQYDRLSEVGVSIGSEGRLEFDREEFREALNQNPDAVAALFTRRVLSDEDSTEQDLPDGVTSTDPNARERFDELGVIGQIEEFVTNYTDSIDGILTSRTQSLDTQILSQQDRIDSLTEGLDRERARLEAQFVAMEQALAQLQSQQAALSSLTSSG